MIILEMKTATMRKTLLAASQMRRRKFSGLAHCTLVPMAFLLSASGVFAGTVYTYVGNDFTTVSGVYTTSDFVTASVILSSALLPNTPLTSYVPTAFTLKDGVQTITQADAPFSDFTFLFATSGGLISSWLIVIQPSTNTDNIGTSDDPTMILLGTRDNGVQVASAGTSNASNSNVPGTWSSTSSQAPEPKTVGMLMLGVFLLAGTKTYQLRKQAMRNSNPSRLITSA